MIRISDADRIRTITLDRPEALNAFSEAMYRDAAAAFAEAARDPEVAVVLVTGSGRAFTAGTDLVELATRVSGGMEGEGSSFPAMIDELVAFPKPLIAAVNGLALGVGASVAVSGAIGFVGLVSPHLARPFVGGDPARALAPSALVGALLLTAADIAVRYIPASSEIHVGVLTAALGVPQQHASLSLGLAPFYSMA